MSREAWTDLDSAVIKAWAYDKDFEIDSTQPSQIVREAVRMGLIGAQDRVVDLGCGKNPRNALYLATNFACTVEGIDIEPVVIPENTPDLVRQRMAFHEQPVMDFALPANSYQAAILARLIQYLPPDEVSRLIGNVSNALTSEGAFLLSYTAQGGIMNKADQYEIETFAHPIASIQETLTASGLSVITLREGTPKSTSTPHAGEPAITYDILAKKSA